MEPDTTERYDRQIRLWGQHGQSKCSNSKICLINANSLGIEVLKGLCLAGIGSFTILDSQKLAPEDVGCSFILQSSIGKSRGEIAKNMLLDLNEEVTGEVFPLEAHLPHFTQTIQNFDMDNNQCACANNFWKQFNCVIASGFLYIDQIIRLSKLCWTLNIPLILCKSIGFYGCFRLQMREHLLIESHPDNALPNFNLDKPFKDLKEYFDSIDLDDEDVQLGKVSTYPYIVIVYKFLKRWQSFNRFPDDRLPNSYSEKKELRTLIQDGLKQILLKRKHLKTKEHNVTISETPLENFIEADKAVNTCLTTSSKLPESVNVIFSHPKVLDASSQNLSRFWMIIKAIKEFVLEKNDNSLPVSGSIPDMISSSEEYIRLQKIYAKKAREDVDYIFELVQTYFNTSNCSPGSSLYDETKLVCKNIEDLKILHTCPVFNEYDFKACPIREDGEEDEFVTLGLCLKAVDIFFSTYGRLPGVQDDQVETDISKLKDCIKQIIGKITNHLKTLDQCSYELCRYGGTELHATSAFLGGCIAQEVIKLITNQYSPVDDTLIYNAMTATTKSFRYSDIFTERTDIETSKRTCTTN